MKEIDFSQESLFSTALLAWYTDVKHEIKEVTSGYRLALVYNLIHVATPGVPQPGLPDMSNSQNLLRRVLEKWRDGMYKDKYPEFGLPERKIAVYVLEHQYSLANLKEGAKSLKGVDAHKVAYIRPIAEDLGFSVGIASLKHRVTSPSSSDYDEDVIDRCGEPEADVTTTIENVVDLCGSTLIPVEKLDTCDVHVIPEGLFDDETPDNSDDEDYMEDVRQFIILLNPTFY